MIQRATFIQRLLRSAAQFSAGQMAAMLASILRIGVSARVLPHDVVGTWIGMQLVMSYAANLHCGTLFGAFRSIPMLNARGDSDGAEDEKRTSFTFVAAVAALTAAPLYVITRVVCPSATRWQLAGVVALIAATLFRSYFNTVFKAQSRFKELAKAMAYGAVGGIVTLPLIAKLGLAGLIATMAAQIVVEVGYLLFFEHLPRLRIRWGVLWEQLRVGVMTLLTSLGFVLITTVDRTVMLERFGTNETGFYYIGANIMALMPVIAAMPAAVLTPQFFERVGRGEDIGPLVEKPVRLAALGFAILVAVGSMMLPYTIRILWPNLVAGTGAAQCALFATYPLVLVGLVTNVYYAHDKQGLHVIIVFVAAAIGFGLAHAGASLIGTITGAALGGATGLFLYFPIVTIGAFFVLGKTRASWRVVFEGTWPLVYAGGVALAVQLGVTHVRAPFVRALLGTCVVGVAVAPLAWRARTLLRHELRAP